MRLPELQRAFAARMLNGDDAIMSVIQDSSLERRDVLMGVYEHAYGARLAEVLEGDYEKLHAAIGPDAFLQIAADYVSSEPIPPPECPLFWRWRPRIPAANRTVVRNALAWRAGHAGMGHGRGFPGRGCARIYPWKPWRHCTRTIGRT